MRRSLPFLLVLSLTVTALVVAQSRSRAGSISGVVKDTAGGVLPGVTVQLAGTALPERTRSTVTDSGGQYRFANLERGKYTVTFSLKGFTTIEHADVELAPGFNARLNQELKAGSMNDIVTVTGATPMVPMVDGQSAAKRATLQSAEMANTPPGRAVGADAEYGSAADFRAMAAPAIASLARDGFNTEAYDRIDDNQWADATSKPLSTFSIDVDTASYANVRRFLNSSQLPPKDAVRIEELINYFTYDYEQPKGRTPFSITTSIGEAPWNPRHRLVLIGLQAQRIDPSEMPPRNLVFLVDVSGSMSAPNKLPLVKSSLAMLARNLTARDRIAIVVYAGAAGLVLPSTEGSDQSRVLEALGQLESGGSTNGAQGIQLAYHVARQNFIRGGVNRVVLATDGDFNVGVSSPGDLVRLVEENRQSGVSLSVLGFGMGNLKDATMEKLADKGNGNYSYIDSLAEARKVLVHEAGGTLVTVAKDVKLQVEFNPRTVGAYRLIGYENRVLQDRDFNDDRKDAGDMGAGHSVTALYEITPADERIRPGVDPLKYQRQTTQPATAWQGEAMTVKLRYKQPDSDVSSLVERVVPASVAMSANLGFAAAVAEFGMVLRDSEFKGASSFEHAREMAAKYGGADPHGHRSEFIQLIDKARELADRR